MSLIYKLANAIEKCLPESVDIHFNGVTNTCTLSTGKHLVCTAVLDGMGQPSVILFGNKLESSCLTFDVVNYKFNLQDMYDVVETKLLYLGLVSCPYSIKYEEERGICMVPKSHMDSRCEVDESYVDSVLSLFEYKEKILGHVGTIFIQFTSEPQFIKQKITHTKGEFELLKKQLKILNALHKTNAAE